MDDCFGGPFAGAGVSGCTFSGTVASRSSGEAVCNVSIAFNRGACVFGPQTIAGTAAAAAAGSPPN